MEPSTVAMLKPLRYTMYAVMPTDDCEGNQVIRILRGAMTLASGFPGVVGFKTCTGSLLPALDNDVDEIEDAARLDRW